MQKRDDANAGINVKVNLTGLLLPAVESAFGLGSIALVARVVARHHAAVSADKSQPVAHSRRDNDDLVGVRALGNGISRRQVEALFKYHFDVSLLDTAFDE